jgi:putative salt-induced outer membrane protein YdiY
MISAPKGSAAGDPTRSVPRLALAIALVMLAGSTAFADHVGLKNGDRLTGKVVRSDGKTLLIHTELAGDVTVAWDAVVEMSADAPVFVALADGRTVSGAISSSAGHVEVQPADGASVVVVAPSEVVALRSAEEQAEFERTVSPGWFELWEGGANFGLAFTKGNSDTTTVTSGVALTRRTPRDQTSVYLASLYSRDGNAEPESRTTANAVRGGVRYERDITNRLFGYGFVDFEHNSPQDLSLRLVPGGGLGFHLIRTERTHLDVFGGGAYNREWFDVAPDRNSAEIQVGQSLSFHLGDRTTVAEQFVVFPNLSDAGEYRINFDTAATTAITKRLGWQFAVSDRFLSNPPPGFERNDLIVTTGLTFRLGRLPK